MRAERMGRAGVAGLALFLASCTGDAPDPEGANVAEQEEGRPVELVTFERRAAAGDGPVPTFHLAAMSGTLAARNGCVVLDAAERSFALVFEAGSATWDPASRSLRVDGVELREGDRIEMGGSGGPAVGALSGPDAAARCGTDDIWIVNPGSLSKQG